MDINVVPLLAEKMKAKATDESQLGFGRHFTDRMLLVEWKSGQGWCDARISPTPRLRSTRPVWFSTMPRSGKTIMEEKNWIQTPDFDLSKDKAEMLLFDLV